MEVALSHAAGALKDSSLIQILIHALDLRSILHAGAQLQDLSTFALLFDQSERNC